MDTRENQETDKPAETPPASQENLPSEKLDLAAHRRARRRQASQEAFWAGRNRAARRSTRAAA